jgi:hypothetical protein
VSCTILDTPGVRWCRIDEFWPRHLAIKWSRDRTRTSGCYGQQSRGVLGAGVTGTALIASSKRKAGNVVVHGPCISAVLPFRCGRCEPTAKRQWRRDHFGDVRIQGKIILKMDLREIEEPG